MGDLTIDVVFDPTCPWCFVGKRRLEAALRQRPRLSPRLRWWPFLLDPDMPREGMDRQSYVVRRYGSRDRAKRACRVILEAGQAAGIAFAFDAIRRAPRSLDAHRLVRCADTVGRAGQAVEMLFSAHLVDGLDIGDPDVLVEIGTRLGLDAPGLRAHLSGDADVEPIQREDARARRLGIGGVPSFVFNDTMTIAGAQDAQVLVRMLDVSRESVGAVAASA